MLQGKESDSASAFNDTLDFAFIYMFFFRLSIFPMYFTWIHGHPRTARQAAPLPGSAAVLTKSESESEIVYFFDENRDVIFTYKNTLIYEDYEQKIGGNRSILLIDVTN